MHANEKNETYAKTTPKMIFILLEFSSPIPSLVFQRNWRTYTYYNRIFYISWLLEIIFL